MIQMRAWRIVLRVEGKVYARIFNDQRRVLRHDMYALLKNWYSSPPIDMTDISVAMILLASAVTDWKTGSSSESINARSYRTCQGFFAG